MSETSSSKVIQWKEIFSFKAVFFTILGAICGVIAIKGFMIPNHLLDGGITGISILLHEIFHIEVSIPLVILNLPFIFLGAKTIGKSFAIHSLFAIILMAVLLTFLEIPTITNDRILIAVFGGVFIGLGIGFVIRGGGVIDGLEVLAEYTNQKAGLTVAEIIMAINTVLFLTAAYKLGIETAMYSILTYFTALLVSQYVVDGFEEYTSMSIISSEYEKVKSVIVNDFGKAITVYKGERGYLPGSFNMKENTDIIVTVVTRLEIHKLKKAILKIDPKAFMYVQSTKEVNGGLIKKIRQH